MCASLRAERRDDVRAASCSGLATMHSQRCRAWSPALDMTRAVSSRRRSPGSRPCARSTDDDRRRLNQIRACSYLHLFDVFETSLGGRGARARARRPRGARRARAAPPARLLRSSRALLRRSRPQFARGVPGRRRGSCRCPTTSRATLDARDRRSSLLVLALHFKLVTQQHYLACVRGDESLEPHFVRLLKEHWCVECGAAATCGSVARHPGGARATRCPAAFPSALRDYRLLVFACDDVLRRQAELDVATLEEARGEPLSRARGPQTSSWRRSRPIARRSSRSAS